MHETKESSTDKLVTVTARIPSDLAKWIDAEFNHGFKQNFILQCFESLQRALTQGDLPPHDAYAQVAARGAIETIAKAGAIDAAHRRRD